jgi:OOP family OmpA-OmpF porin
MKKIVLALVAGMAAFGTARAQAQTMQAPRGYVGLGAAFADHQYRLSGVGNIDHDGYKGSVKVFGGADLDPLWGVEAGYTDFRSSDFSYTVGGGPGRGSSKGYGLYLAGKARWPIQAQAEAFGKLGIAYSHRKLDTNPFIGIDDDNDTGIYAGVGLQWNINPQWALTGEYERYGKKKNFGAKPDVWTVAARFNF